MQSIAPPKRTAASEPGCLLVTSPYLRGPTVIRSSTRMSTSLIDSTWLSSSTTSVNGIPRTGCDVKETKRFFHRIYLWFDPTLHAEEVSGVALEPTEFSKFDRNIGDTFWRCRPQIVGSACGHRLEWYGKWFARALMSCCRRTCLRVEEHVPRIEKCKVV